MGTVTVYLFNADGGLAQELTTEEAECLAKRLQDAIDESKGGQSSVDLGKGSGRKAEIINPDK